MTTGTPRIAGTSPIVPVRDIAASLTFYTEVLGFTVQISNPEHGFAMVQRGSLMISLIAGADEAALTATANNISAQLWMEDVAGYWDEIKDRFGAYPDLASDGPVDRDYGVRELHIKDPDGFLMFFTDLNDFTNGV
ncbi:VOC family protein [Pontivivens insulae]|uniref:VOC domain-containing protein n=1 Tax=Pontivivens insulae TaxID=1639689 RepID=A0A2R8A8S0_9RHOB|nr:VOC family protein [Pontivivens insulae]RED18721.1 catechol 2,3-dioxygenase-like lactoylglutathione lyase family enzyme [Pontivivens insulae]SPF28619.1 hypothetical protein POI8812_00921 [Pontivivens insulae]